MQPWKIRIQKQIKRTLLRTLSPVYRPGAQVKIVMFHGGRSGSSVLSGMLQQHPQMYWGGEVLARHYRPATADKKPFRYQRYLRHLEFSTIRPYYGIEIKPVDLVQLSIPAEEFIRSLLAEGYQNFIILERKNVLRKILSSRAAKQTGIFHVSRDAAPPRHRLHLDTADLHAQLQQNIEAMLSIRNLLADQHVLNLSYEEDILPDPAIGYRRVCTFLDIKLAAAEPQLRRIVAQPLAEILTNYEEVAATLQNTPYVWMLE